MTITKGCKCQNTSVAKYYANEEKLNKQRDYTLDTGTNAKRISVRKILGTPRCWIDQGYFFEARPKAANAKISCAQKKNLVVVVVTVI